MEAAKRVKEEGKENDLLQRIAADPRIGVSAGDLTAIMNIRNFIGRSPEQTVEFIATIIDPLLLRARQYGNAATAELRV